MQIDQLLQIRQTWRSVHACRVAAGVLGALARRYSIFARPSGHRITILRRILFEEGQLERLGI